MRNKAKIGPIILLLVASFLFGLWGFHSQGLTQATDFALCLAFGLGAYGFFRY